MSKEIKVEEINDHLELLALDDKVPEHQIFLKCGKEGCKEKVIINLKLPETIKGLRVEGLYPLCRKHLEEVYKLGIFENGIGDPNNLKLIEGVIKYGSMELWLKNDRKFF